LPELPLLGHRVIKERSMTFSNAGGHRQRVLKTKHFDFSKIQFIDVILLAAVSISLE
jgi:hypothetical protein